MGKAKSFKYISRHKKICEIDGEAELQIPMCTIFIFLYERFLSTSDAREICSLQYIFFIAFCARDKKILSEKSKLSDSNL